MQSIVASGKKNPELKKHVGLIHSTNKLSLLERKIANALLHNAYDNLLKKNEFQIHIPTLCSVIGYNSKDVKTVKKSLLSLISTVLEWNILDGGESDDGIWVASSMLSDARIEGSVCTYSYSNRMRELCYYPEFYGRLNMQVLSKFKSTYGLALYENCIRYQNITQTPWFDMLTYRKLMGVNNEQYVIFRDLNRRVIKPAIKEVNSYASIQIEPEFKKEGRIVTALRFKILKQAKKLDLYEQDEKKRLTLFDRLKINYGLSDIQISNFLERYEETYLFEKMALIESSSSYQEGRIKHLAKYFEKALIEDFQAPKSSKENMEKLRLDKENKTKQKALDEENMQSYKYYQANYLPVILDNLNDREKLQISEEFEQYISKTMYHNIYASQGFTNPLIKDRFADFVRAQRQELLEALMSFSDFCSEKSSAK